MRRAVVNRTTKETKVHVLLNLDGHGNSRVQTGLPFFDHMVTTMATHGLLDLVLTARGDLHVDDHHTIEDVGICLGQALSRALGSRAGLRRFGSAAIPMDESLADAAVDLGGRPHLVYRVVLPRRRIKTFDPALVEHFFEALTTHARLTLHVATRYGSHAHHLLEAVFKAVGRALHEAAAFEARRTGLPTTKGRI